MKWFWSKWIVVPLAASILVSCGDDVSGDFDDRSATKVISAETLPPVDIAALRAEILKRASDSPPPQVHPQQFTVFNGVTNQTVPANKNPQPPQPTTYPEIITEGVIEDYVTIIRIMDARVKMIDAIPRANDPDAPSVLDIKNREASRIIFHNYRTPRSRAPLVMTKPGQDPVTLWNGCSRECSKLILEKYTESVAYVTHDVATGDIIPDSVIEFRRAKTCNELSYGSPAMGLCINGVKPNNAETITKGAGLHVYDKAASPVWPTGFHPDNIPIPQEFRAIYKPAPAFEDLAHVKASNGTKHRALGFKRARKAEELYIDYDYSCVTIRPPIPGNALPYLVTEVIGENSRLTVGTTPHQSNICAGERPQNQRENLFQLSKIQQGNINYSASISVHDISRNLTATYWKDPEKNGGLVKRTIAELQRVHPEFQSTIGYDVAPIVIDLAKRDLGNSYHNNTAFKILRQMPHESMAAHVDDLARILEDTIEPLGCVGMVCPKALKGKESIMWKLGEIFNGAGPNAANYLDRLQIANEKVGGSMGASWYIIGGGRTAAACIGSMGPEMEKITTRYAYGRTHIRDNNFTFHAEQSLRMTGQSEKARQHIEDKLAWMIEKSQDPEMKPSWARTNGLLRSIDRAEKILEEWTDQEPYCPSRPKVP